MDNKYDKINESLKELDDLDILLLSYIEDNGWDGPDNIGSVKIAKDAPTRKMVEEHITGLANKNLIISGGEKMYIANPDVCGLISERLDKMQEISDK